MPHFYRLDKMLSGLKVSGDDRESNSKAAAFPLNTITNDVSPVPFYDCLDYGQSKTASAGSTGGTGGGHCVGTAEDVR